MVSVCRENPHPFANNPDAAVLGRRRYRGRVCSFDGRTVVPPDHMPGMQYGGTLNPRRHENQDIPLPLIQTRGAVSIMHAALAAVTLSFFSLAFVLWLWRSAAVARKEVSILRNQRRDLVENIREANREIDSLRNALSLCRMEPGPTIAQQKMQDLQAPKATPLLGLPVSFDNGPGDQKIVALTFDGGSLDNAVADILDTLASRNVRATMFVSGEFIRRFPKAILRIAAAGHEFGNHTATHPHLTTWQRDRTHSTLPGIDATTIAFELHKANEAFRKVTGHPMLPIWRAPYGEKNRQICLWAQMAGYLHIGWRQGRSWRETLDTNDWIPNEESAGYHEPEEILNKILAIACGPPPALNGGIILLHLGTARTDRQSQVHRIIGTLIDRLSAEGYQFVTISQMLAAAGVTTKPLEEIRAQNERKFKFR